MIKLVITSILLLLSTNALGMEDEGLNAVDMTGAMILIIPLTLLFSTVFIYYKNKKKVINKKSYASTNVIVEQGKYVTPKIKNNNQNTNDILDTLDIITDLIPNHSTKVASAIAVNEIIDNDGEMSGGGSTLDFDLDLDFDWD